MSVLMARRAPSASFKRHAHRRLDLYSHAAHVAADARHQQHVQVVRVDARVRERVARRAERKGVRVLAGAGNATLADTCQPLELDVGLVLRARHQLIGGQPPGRDARADAGEPARVRRASRRAAGASRQRHPVSAVTRRLILVLHSAIRLRTTLLKPL